MLKKEHAECGSEVCYVFREASEMLEDFYPDQMSQKRKSLDAIMVHTMFAEQMVLKLKA